MSQTASNGEFLSASNVRGPLPWFALPTAPPPGPAQNCTASAQSAITLKLCSSSNRQVLIISTWVARAPAAASPPVVAAAEAAAGSRAAANPQTGAGVAPQLPNLAGVVAAATATPGLEVQSHLAGVEGRRLQGKGSLASRILDAHLLVSSKTMNAHLLLLIENHGVGWHNLHSRAPYTSCALFVAH